MPSGGLHPPTNPAQVSGPGELSQRTDGKPQPKMALPGAGYGEQKTFQEIQQGAPAGAPASGAGAPMPAQPPTGFGDPSTRPEEPVTAGADAGAGPGSEALALPKGESQDELRKKFGPILPALIAEASGPYATQAYRDSVQALIASM